MPKFFDRLVLIATCLAFCVVVLGAYVRLSDAGLGCPDWPGCYGHLTVPHADAAQEAFPDRPLEQHKAWKEMAHRYFAGTLGLLILGIALIAWRSRGSIPRMLPTVLLGLVMFQAALGMWTVTLLLKPVIVSLHLLGGMATLGLLAWLSASRRPHQDFVGSGLRFWAVLGLLILLGQILLGGWTSSNYAALACADFPTCQSQWWPQTDFADAFHLLRDLGVGADGSQLSGTALVSIHLAHRIGAVLTFVYLGWLGSRLLKQPGLALSGWALLGLLLLQVCLGIGNVLFSLPLPVAVGHNAGAAMLLVTLAVINSKFNSGRLS